MTTQQSSFRVVFVGGGSMARAHARALRLVRSGLTIAGVFDADAAVAGEFASATGATVFDSLDTMLTELRPDVVHVCTTAGAHFEAARLALETGAHIYVEKPFVETLDEARTLLSLAAARNRIVCAGHQLIADPVYGQLRDKSTCLAPLVRAESELQFRSPTLRPDSPRSARVAQLLDVLPHPLYALVAALEWMAPGEDIALTAVAASSTSLDAVVRSGVASGRLHVSLDARPVTSTLSLVGENGTLSADFIRGCVTGVTNPGASPIEKILNPAIAGAATAFRSLTGIARRLAGHAEYPGLVPLLRSFYAAVSAGAPSPLSADHLLHVARLHEELTRAIRQSSSMVQSTTAARLSRQTRSASFHRSSAVAPLVAVTGASGFLGRQLSRQLAERGFRVRGIGRGPDPEDASIHEWIRADLSRPIDPRVFDGVQTVVHAVAATSGGFVVHQRHSVDSSRHLLDAMRLAGVRQLVHVSSLSVVRPPRSLAEVQDERTPLASAPEALGPYTWGKCASERLIVEGAEANRIDVRVIRPGALTDRRSPELPGLVGKRLFGTWHLGLGRPSLPVAACDVVLAASAIAECAARFDEAPQFVNLIDPDIRTRGELLRRMRSEGWTGKAIWVPISLLAGGVTLARWALALVRGKRPDRLAVWQILRPRRFDTTVSARLFGMIRDSRSQTVPDSGSQAAPDAAMSLMDVAATG